MSATGAVRVAVIGDVMVDHYRAARVVGVCREAPAPKLVLEGDRRSPGGAANVALSLAALGARVRIVGAAGDDPEGGGLASHLGRAGVGWEGLVRVPGRHTPVKERLVADGRVVMRVDRGDRDPLDALSERRVLAAVEHAWGWADAVVVADYEHGVLTPAVVDAIAALRRPPGGPVLVIDSARLAAWRASRPHLVTPNAAEALALLGEGTSRAGDPPPREALVRRAARLLDVTGAAAAVVTLDRGGALVVREGREPRPVGVRPVADTGAIGAGDAFTAAVTVQVARGLPLEDAARSACAAAAAAVARGGTAVCRPEDLVVAAAPVVPGVLGRAELAALGRRARAEGRRVVFTNGCFDVLHPGHVTLLERARALGDLLVLGLNGDAAVTRLKGPGRPVLGLAERARLLGALACVDHVAAFEEDTAEGLVAALRPDVYAKGAATPRDEPPEAVAARALGADVRYLPLPEDGPTGELLGRIRGVAGRGATTA